MVLARSPVLVTGAASVGRSPDAPTTLSPRERQVIEMLSIGLRYKQIGFELGISEMTAKEFVYRAMARLGAHTAEHCVAIFVASTISALARAERDAHRS